jgi:hypothetical protein
MKNIAEEYAQRIWDKKDLNAINDLLDPTFEKFPMNIRQFRQ